MNCHWEKNSRLPLSTCDLRLASCDYSAFLFELFFFGRAEPRRRTQRFAVIEQREIAHVQRQRAAGRFLVHDDGDGTPLDAFPKRDPAATGQPRVRKSL